VNPRRSPRRSAWIAFAAVAGVVALGFLMPEDVRVPVEDATARDWNPQSFWYEPWGISGVHKGIDVFAPQGRAVVAATPGIVVFRGQLGLGGNVVAVLGPKWRIHYYAHLASSDQVPFLVAQGEQIGRVGTSGNAAGKAPHLHYAILSLVPLPWRYSGVTQGWKQMFFLDPGALLRRGD
jgi:peptidoglycan LD-endopeptidase LytH